MFSDITNARNHKIERKAYIDKDERHTTLVPKDSSSKDIQFAPKNKAEESHRSSNRDREMVMGGRDIHGAIREFDYGPRNIGWDTFLLSAYEGDKYREMWGQPPPPYEGRLPMEDIRRDNQDSTPSLMPNMMAKQASPYYNDYSRGPNSDRPLNYDPPDSQYYKTPRHSDRRPFPQSPYASGTKDHDMDYPKLKMQHSDQHNRKRYSSQPYGLGRVNAMPGPSSFGGSNRYMEGYTRNMKRPIRNMEDPSRKLVGFSRNNETGRYVRRQDIPADSRRINEGMPLGQPRKTDEQYLMERRNMEEKGYRRGTFDKKVPRDRSDLAKLPSSKMNDDHLIKRWDRSGLPTPMKSTNDFRDRGSYGDQAPAYSIPPTAPEKRNTSPVNMDDRRLKDYPSPRREPWSQQQHPPTRDINFNRDCPLHSTPRNYEERVEVFRTNEEPPPSGIKAEMRRDRERSPTKCDKRPPKRRLSRSKSQGGGGRGRRESPPRKHLVAKPREEITGVNREFSEEAREGKRVNRSVWASEEVHGGNMTAPPVNEWPQKQLSSFRNLCRCHVITNKKMRSGLP